MAAPSQIDRLIKQFDRNLQAYRAAEYKETQLRIEFVDPFFKALGWDVDNERGYAEAYKDVIHEDAIKVGGATKAPDYCFRIGGTRKFFLEAKKPSVSIKDEISPAFQLRRYAWSAKLPLSILTDFEEFAVYDCRIRPLKTDRPDKARVLYMKYTDYERRWDEIAAIFSRDAVLKGSFDKYAESKKRMKGTAEVDTAFLKEIESWREVLARNFALRNPKLTQRELNFAVQRTIDRIIFLRMCEDRGIEPYGQLLGLRNGQAVYRRLGELFRRADERYNSSLFYFTPEAHREPPDELTLGLDLDDKPLKDILGGLYYPDCPYEFSVLPADILGQVYEQFLGKVIRLTKGHRAVVEDKPEVKKAGGVYYTPTYIVDYIVKHTVGRLLGEPAQGSRVQGPGSGVADAESSVRTLDPKPKTLTPADASRLRILDPACGSGSFLIAAYQYLLDWHLDYYTTHDPEKWARQKTPRIYQALNPEPRTLTPGWRLTTAERKRILLTHIFGVDIDPQAVEVTKLSLLLKVLEGESQQTLDSQLRLFHERALPDLNNNIKCGNSLIGPDFYDNQQMSFLDEEERYRINVFDWQDEFPEIMKAGGFDAVIGNPPYVDIKALPEADVRYIFGKFAFANNRINLFATFIERVLTIVSPDFRFSMIVPTALLSQDSYRPLRESICRHQHIASLVRLPNESFGSSAGEVKVDTVVFVLCSKSEEHEGTEIIGYAGYDRISRIDPTTAHVYGHVRQETWAATQDCLWSINLTEEQEAILKKCERPGIALEECAEFCLGLTPYDKYKGHTQSQISNRVFHSSTKKDETFRKLLAGNDVRRYSVIWNGEQWITYGPWLGAPREQRFFTEKRILVKQIIDWTTKRIWGALAEEELYNTQNAFILLAKDEYALEYLLGILNSRLMTFYHRKRYLDEFKMRFQKILIKDCKTFPIRALDMGCPDDRAQHDRMVGFVNETLALHKQLAEAKTGHEKASLQRQIAATDCQIDGLVYELYGLTGEEICIVEEATNA